MGSDLAGHRLAIARFREALALLEADADWTFATYRAVWDRAGAGLDDAQLRAMWEGRDLLALGTGDPDALRTITRRSLLEGLHRLEAQLAQAEAEAELAVPARGTPPDGITPARVERHIVTLLDELETLSRRGDYQRALANASILPAGASRLGDSHPLVAKVFATLAGFYDRLGEFVLAERTCRRYLAALRRHGLDRGPAFARMLAILASVREKTGNDADAERLLRRALHLRTAHGEADDPDADRVRQQLAVVLHRRGEVGEAEALLREAAERTRRAFGPQSGTYASALEWIAQLALRRGSWADAEATFRNVLAIRSIVLADGHPQHADARHGLGAALDGLGRFADAGRELGEALAIRRTSLGELHPDFGATAADLACVRAAQGRIEEAHGLFRDAFRADDRLIGQAFALASERQRIDFLVTRWVLLSKYLSLLATATPSLDEIQNAATLVLRRKGLAAEASLRGRDVLLADRDPAVRSRLAELGRLRTHLAQRSYAGPRPDESADDYRRSLDVLARRREALERELAGDVPEHELTSHLERTTWQSVAALIPAGTQLVEYIRVRTYDFRAVPARGEPRWTTARYLAFVLAADSGPRLVDLGDAGPIDRAVEAFLDVVARPPDDEDGRDMIMTPARGPAAPEPDAGHGLRRAVVDPLALDPQAKALIVAPDGELARVPFGALPAADGRRLIECRGFSYVGCGRDMLRWAQTSARTPADPVVVADPDYDLVADSGAPVLEVAGRRDRAGDPEWAALAFVPLPGTREEGTRVATRLKVTPWLGRDALKRRVRSVRSPWILHLATHGFFLADREADPGAGGPAVGGDLGRFTTVRFDNPLLRSGLALAGGNAWLQGRSPPSEADDGILTADDAAGLDLAETELVVLSACETGLGTIQIGDGVLGFRRSFALAGAKTLTLSLWKIPDEETCALMDGFYRRVLRGEPRAEALRAAQLELMARRPHPYSWGAFICQGEPGPLPPRRRWYYRGDGSAAPARHGPVSDAELKDLIRSGRLPRMGQVSRDGTAWHPAERLSGVAWPTPS